MVSEESGKISLVVDGEMEIGLKPAVLRERLIVLMARRGRAEERPDEARSPAL